MPTDTGTEDIGLQNIEASKANWRKDDDRDALIRQQQELLREAYGALESIGEHYVQLAACGDCGSWNPEEEEKVIQYRATLSKIKTALVDV